MDGILPDIIRPPQDPPVNNASTPTSAPISALTSVPTSAPVSEGFGFPALRPNTRKLPSLSIFLPDILPDFITGSTKDEDNDDEERKKLNMALCLMNVILPPDSIGAVEDAIENVADIVHVVIELMENGGFELPGEIILAFFGWAEYEKGEGFVAPFKWWYCMGAVAIFLGRIEILKLFAIQFIVWTNRS